MPIWPELYEEKGALLNENQLLYAVLQVDKREEAMRLNCAWLDDLTKADEAMIEKCDQAFDKASDKAKYKTTRYQKAPAVSEVVKPKEVKNITLRVDLGLIRMSQILKMKSLLRSSPGASGVKIEFHAQGGCQSVLLLHDGVTSHDALLSEFRSLAGVEVV